MACLALTVLTVACTGRVGDPGPTGSNVGGTPNTGPTIPGAKACTAPPSASNFHRLNAKQYQESVNQVLGLSLPLQQDLPQDASLYGFDNNADTSLTAALTQRYLDAAKKAVTAAFADPAARARLLTCDLKTGASCVRSILSGWLPKVFRRPVLASEIDAYQSYLTTCASSTEAGLSCAMQAALLSPKFLFRAEVLPSSEAQICSDETPLISTSKNILGQYALASRLSYFLWNAPPDDALYAAAASGTLDKPGVLAAQVDRMLAPPALDQHQVSFVNDFPSQWLPLVALQSAQPSKTKFPAFDEPLRQAMADESRLFFSDILLKNGSALDLLRADHTYLNERLAKHYGVAGVTGPDMRRVDTSGLNRGGIPTQGSFLTATSSTESTSIVLRAKWILSNLLCVELPPPPDKSIIDSVPVPDPGLGLTARQSLEIRTAGEPCHSCHVNINPVGFGLEIFDAVGALRSTDNGKPIDPSGVLPGDIKFANTGELLDDLRKDDRFASCVTQKMLTYALGRGMVASCDQESIDALGAQLKADGYKMRNHLLRIVQSSLFTNSRARGEVSP
ncbi:MAG TPA: DUF1592 domain-containing protein [Polyangia bacterium]|nr:DUF1592 domain-containing protein [Polyangia bacterium]